MSLVPTSKAIIGQFINGRNATDDFLQLATNHGGTVFGWIDSDGKLQGTLANSVVASLNGLTGAVTLAAGTNITLTPVGNTITISSTGGGGIGGSISAGQIAVGSGVNTVGGSAALTYSAGFLQLTSTSGADITDQSSSGLTLSVSGTGTGQLTIRTDVNSTNGILIENDGTGSASGITINNNSGGDGGVAIEDSSPTAGLNISETGNGGLFITNTGTGSTTIDATNASGVLSLNPTGKNITVGGPIISNVTISNPTAATGGANHSSPILTLDGTYWTGAVSAVDQWTIQNIPSAGSNPTTTLTINHSGSSGAPQVSFNAALSCGGINASSISVGSAGMNILNAGALNFQSANGATRILGQASEEITLSLAGTTTDSSANLLPAGAIIESVNAFITQTISGGSTPTTWQAGDATTASRFISTGNALTASTTAVGLNQMKGGVSTDAAGPTQASAAKVRITLDQIPGQGKIRITVFYSQFTAPTS